MKVEEMTIKEKAKSIVVSRKPGLDKDGLWSVMVGLFETNNPHLKAKVPFKSLEFTECVKVRLHDLRNVSLYLMGNDLVINDLLSVQFDLDENSRILTVSGKQSL